MNQTNNQKNYEQLLQENDLGAPNPSVSYGNEPAALVQSSRQEESFIYAHRLDIGIAVAVILAAVALVVALKRPKTAARS
jgi:hypothetical protein